MTRAQLRTRLQALGYSTDTATVQNELLNQAYQTVAGLRRWPWLEADSTALTATASNFDVSLAGITDLMWIDAVRIEFGTDYIDLEHLEPQAFRDMQHVDRLDGMPKYWTEIAGELRLFPRPDRAYTLTVDYIKQPADLDDDADVPLFDPAYHDLLVWGAARQLAYRQRDWNAAQFADDQGTRQLMAMMGSYGVRQRQTAREVVHRPDRYRDRSY